MNERKLNIVIIDDHPIFRMGLVRSLEDEPGMTIVAEGASSDEALLLFIQHRPDIVLLDLSMPGGGHTAISAILAEDAKAIIVVLTASEQQGDIVEAIEAGARAYVLKGVESSELVRIMRDVFEGKTYVSPPLASRMSRSFDGGRVKTPSRHETHDRHAMSDLTAREEQILVLVADGNSNKEVARLLNLQEKSIKHVMTRVLRKLHARNRTEAAKYWRDAHSKD
ncbi:response regulator transcription factor [Agrobacterium sp. SORGH_AS 787]|uniref:response regulator transcription factor n=1 Tax=Agrobacterium sp. SORGH_AS 787 TaxID=3041775 RepID=UPI00277EACDE|nr:two-component system nitrate/nitrite response regulator NarL [Rhizobium sp. SORGH_AS_0787]